jgi:hypothetical protein
MGRLRSALVYDCVGSDPGLALAGGRRASTTGPFRRFLRARLPARSRLAAARLLVRPSSLRLRRAGFSGRPSSSLASGQPGRKDRRLLDQPQQICVAGESVLLTRAIVFMTRPLKSIRRSVPPRRRSIRIQPQRELAQCTCFEDTARDDVLVYKRYYCDSSHLQPSRC